MNDPAAFESVVRDAFGFLLERGFRVRESTDRDGITVSLTNGRDFVLEIQCDEDRNVLMAFAPLVNGRVPSYFTADGRENLARVDLSDVLRELDPRWTEPPTHVGQAGGVELVLRAYALTLAAQIEALLADWDGIYERARVAHLRELAARFAEQWAAYVERLRRGDQIAPAWHAHEITARGQLEDALDELSMPQLRESVQSLDAEFDALTEPSSFNASPVRPTPRSERWWRLPPRASA